MELTLLTVPAGPNAAAFEERLASTLAGHHPAAQRRARPRGRVLAQFVAHSPPSGAVHRQPRGPRSGSSRTVAAPGEQRPAVLESVLVSYRHLWKTVGRRRGGAPQSCVLRPLRARTGHLRTRFRR